MGVGLTRMAVTPLRRRPFCSGTVAPSEAEAMEAGFSPSTGQRSGRYVHPVGPEWELRLYRHAQDHRLLTRDILGYPSLIGDILG